MATEFAEKPSLASVRSSFDDRTGVYTSLGWEMVLDRIGFGVEADVLFGRAEAQQPEDLYDWWLDWNGEGFLSYHLFGGGSGVDPFLRVGYGNAGRADLQENGYSEEDVTSLSLYPFVSGGVALDLGGLLLGAHADYRPIVNPVPATQFADYPLTTFQVTLFAGLVLGSH